MSAKVRLFTQKLTFGANAVMRMPATAVGHGCARRATEGGNESPGADWADRRRPVLSGKSNELLSSSRNVSFGAGA